MEFASNDPHRNLMHYGMRHVMCRDGMVHMSFTVWYDAWWYGQICVFRYGIACVVVVISHDMKWYALLCRGGMAYVFMRCYTVLCRGL
eukprot:3742715-Pyramimonas_sp.AAC.1